MRQFNSPKHSETKGESNDMSILISHPFCALHLSQVFHDMMYAQLGHAPARTVVQDTELRHQAG